MCIETIKCVKGVPAIQEIFYSEDGERGREIFLGRI